MVTAGKNVTFQKFASSLEKPQRQVICESYLQYLMSEQAWQSQIPDFRHGKKGVNILSKAAVDRLRGRNAQSKKVDRMSLGRKYRSWHVDAVKAGKLYQREPN